MVNSLDAVFGALADPTRRRIVERLARRPLTVGEIAADFSISQPAISKHLRVLEDAGLLKRDIVGRTHHCRLEPKTMQAASGWLESQQRFWNAAFERLDTYLATSERKRK